MGKKSIITKSAAFFMAAAMAIITVGCGAKEQSDSDAVLKNETGSSAGITEEGSSDAASGDTTGTNGMGRYVESAVFDGGGFSGKVETQTMSDGQLVFIDSISQQRIVSDDGTAWKDETNDAHAAFAEEHYPFAMAIAKDGTLAFVSMDERSGAADGERAEYDFNLYIYNTDNTTKQITVELPDADSHLSELAFDEQGVLYAYASRCRNIYKVDINEETAEKLVTLDDSCDFMQCRDNILMCMTFEKIFLYDLENKSFIEDETFDSFMEETYGEAAWTGGGYTAYAFLGTDNAIYVAGDKGLYRHVIGGSAVEQIIDGSLSSLGDPTCSIMSMTMNEENEFFTAYANGKIVKSAYDATVSTVPDEKITVYSLSEDDLVKQTMSAYRTQYPDMFIEYQIGMEGGGITREDALKNLNTQLLSGNGPDVIMLDGMNIDTYAEKGVLMDLSELVNEADQKEGLYRNLIDCMKTDDKTYAVPAKFCIPVIYGKEEYVSDVNDYKAVADMVEKARESYPDTSLLIPCSATGIMKETVPVCAPSWKDDKGQLDQSKIREFLEQSRRIYDAEINGTPQEYIDMYQQRLIEEDGTEFEDSKYFLMVNDNFYLMQETPFAYGEIIDAYTYRDALSLPRAQGAEDTVIKLMNGQSSNVYHPQSIAGINTATKNPDASKQFVSMMLSATVQENLQFGLPVNKKALPAQFAYDESDLGDDGGQFYTSFSYQDGRSFSQTIYPVNQDGIDKLEDWIAQFDTPYLRDTVLEDVVFAEGAKYLEGKQDIDSAMKAIVDSMEIYLYE